MGRKITIKFKKYFNKNSLPKLQLVLLTVITFDAYKHTITITK